MGNRRDFFKKGMALTGLALLAPVFVKTSKATNNYVYIVKSTCFGCGLCIDQCPPNAMTLSGGKASIDQDYCIGCGSCTVVCANDSIVLVPAQGMYHIISGRCTGCGNCAGVCSVGAIFSDGSGKYRVNEECISCGSCVSECSYQALTYY